MLLPENNIMMVIKFGEKRWMKKIADGELSFSCAGAFIKQAETTNNNIQGDLLEGVFAHLYKGSEKINEMRIKLGKDLEEIDDGEFIYLRRKSAKFKPIFCVYGYKISDVIKDGDPAEEGWKNVTHLFDQNMYSGFSPYNVQNVISESHRPTMLLIQAETFKIATRLALLSYRENLSYYIKHVSYQDIKSEEFFVQPTDEYQELFIKSDSYEYQHETRICICNKSLRSIYDRFNLSAGPIPKGDYYFVHTPVQLDFRVHFDENQHIKSI